MKNVIRLGKTKKKQHRRPKLKQPAVHLVALGSDEEEVVIGKVVEFKELPSIVEGVTEIAPVHTPDEPEVKSPETAPGDDEEAIAKPAPRKRRRRSNAAAKADNTPLEK